MNRALTKIQRDALYSVAWGVRHFGGLVASDATPTRVLRALERRGLVASQGDVLVCDGDGCALDPERYREGWELTPAGRAELERDTVGSWKRA
jgi:hypothetical protein